MTSVPKGIRWGAFAGLVAAIVLTISVRIRLAEVPLERDEGEYAYAGQLILAGEPPYAEAYNMKFPGIYYAYAAVMAVFGETTAGIRYGLIVVNLATAGVILLLGRRLAGDVAGSVAAISYLILSLSPSGFGVFGHATHFVALPALAGLLVLLHTGGSRRGLAIAAGGALLGVALLMKQHGFVYLVLGIGLLLWPAARRGRVVLDLVLFIGSAFVPFLLVCALFLTQGVFQKFWFWTFRYAWEYVTRVPYSEAWDNFIDGLRAAVGPNLPLWLLGLAGLFVLWAGRRRETFVKGFVSALVVISILGVVPGFYFRAHYFILVLPVVALLGGIAVADIGRRFIVAALFALLIAMCLYPQRDLLFSMPPLQVSRTLFGANPFPEAVEVARYLREHSSPSDRVAVIGSEPEIYFLSNRRGATGYIYTYGLMEPQPYAAKMQREMMREIEVAHPEYLVEIQVPTSWLIRPKSDRTILSWVGRYTQRCYDLAGIADIQSEDHTSYVWDDRLRGYQRSSKFAILVHRRKGASPCAAGEAP